MCRTCVIFVKISSVTTIIFLGVKGKFVPVISPTIWAKLGAGDLHVILLGYDRFHKNRCSERCALVSGTDEFLPVYCSLRPI